MLSRSKSFVAVLSWAMLAVIACSSKSLDDSANEPTTVNEAKVSLVSVFARGKAGSITDLDFDPLRPGELWATLREAGAEGECTSDVQNGCAALEGHVVIVKDPSAATPVVQTKTDPNGWHFMRRPAGIAFGTNGNFATCGETRTANFTDDSVDYNGPALWSSDPEIFAIQPPGKNGSHLDMLHATPYCMGVAHERDNVYWAFNGNVGSLDRYDFAEPHEIGGEDHSDGSLRRYIVSTLKRKVDVPSHLAYDPQSALLYAADTGNARVVRLDTTSGTEGSQVPVYEQMVQHVYVDGATLSELVAPGVIAAPSGIALHASKLYVTDNATGKIFVLGLDGAIQQILATDLASGALAGIAIDPRDGAIYVADMLNAAIWRVVP